MKRLIAASAALILAGAAAGVPGLISAQTGPAWTTFHGSGTRIGVSTVNGPTAGTASNIWTLPRAIESSPVIDAGGTAYVGDDNGSVYAFNASNPRDPLWTFKTQDQVTAAPTLSGDGKTLYVASNDGSVYALKSADGTKIWSANVAGILQSSPLLSSDGSTLFIGLVAGQVDALKSSDGTLAWKQAINGAIPGSLALSPDGSTIYVATYNSIMYGLPSSGPQNGSIQAYYLDGQAVSTPALDPNGNIYVTTSVGSLVAFTPGNGTAKFTFSVPNHNAALSTPAIFNGTVYFGDADQNFYAVSATSGQQVWFAHTGGSIKSSPAIAAGNSLVYFGSDDGGVLALNATTGALVWRKGTGAAVSSSPGIGPDSSLWVGSQTGMLYRFHDVTPPPQPQATATRPAGSPTATATTGPTSTATPTVGPTQTTLSFTLKSKVVAGKKQFLTITSTAGTVLHVRVDYPNGDHQSHRVTAGPKGIAKYSYVQGLSKIRHNNFSASVTVRTDAGGSVTRQYQILFGAMDVSAEPRSVAVGHAVSIWIHTGGNRRVMAYVLFPNGKFARLHGVTGPNGFAHLKFKITRGLTTNGNKKASVVARPDQAGARLSTKTTFTIR